MYVNNYSMLMVLTGKEFQCFRISWRRAALRARGGSDPGVQLEGEAVALVFTGGGLLREFAETRSRGLGGRPFVGESAGLMLLCGFRHGLGAADLGGVFRLLRSARFCTREAPGRLLPWGSRRRLFSYDGAGPAGNVLGYQNFLRRMGRGPRVRFPS